MKRSGRKVATDRSFVVALSRGLDVLRAFHPNDGLLGNQEIAARTNLPKPTVSRLTYTLTKLGYLTPVPRFENYQLAPSAMSLGYASVPARPSHAMDSRSRPANRTGVFFCRKRMDNQYPCSLS